MGVTPDLAEIIEEAIRSRVHDVYTTLPARVVTYNAAKQVADLEIVVRVPLETEDGEIVNEDFPLIPNVPIVFPRGGGCSITWPLSPGDHVMWHVSTLATGVWRETGLTSDPVDIRRHCVGYGFAVPGIAPNAETLPSAVDPGIVLTGDVKLGSVAASDFVALATPARDEIQAVVNVILGWTPIANDGGAALKAAFAGYVVGDVAATKVRAE